MLVLQGIRINKRSSQKRIYNLEVTLDTERWVHVEYDFRPNYNKRRIYQKTEYFFKYWRIIFINHEKSVIENINKPLLNMILTKIRNYKIENILE